MCSLSLKNVICTFWMESSVWSRYQSQGWPDVITVFLRSLTEYWDGKIIAVIVSGYDGDGAAALCGIEKWGALLSRKSSTSQAAGYA